MQPAGGVHRFVVQSLSPNTRGKQSGLDQLFFWME